MKALAVEGWMQPSELAWLATAAWEARRIVEVGSWKGRSTMALAESMPADGILWAVDTWEGDPGNDCQMREMREAGPGSVRAEFERNLAEYLATGRVRQLAMPSVDGAARLLESEGRVFDLAFIDAAHDHESVAADIRALLPLIRPGGVLAGHDYDGRGIPGVKRAVDEAFGHRARRGPETLWYVEV